MERWRSFFCSAEVNLWTICERALTLAYMDDPDDFPSHRDRLAQKLFAPEKLDLEAPEYDAPREIRSDQPTPDSENVQSRGVDALRDSEANNDREYGDHDEAAALTEEMDEERLCRSDVYRIKDTLLDSYQSEREIFNSLQRLELMQLSFGVLKESEIGKTVNNLRKHSSGRVRSLAKWLVSDWKDIAEHWYKSVEDVTGAATAGILPTDLLPDGEEHGLPSPPMDEGALLAARTASIEMSQLFDFMDDETSAGSGNPNSPADNPEQVLSKKSMDCSDDANDLQPLKKHGGHQNSSGRKKSELDPRKTKDRSSVSSSNGHKKREGDDRMPNGSDKRKTSNVHVEKKAQKETIEKRLDSGSNRRMQTSKLSSNAAVSAPPLDQKILASKRKLQENYQQAEIAKRQRTIQVMELQDLPKGGPKKLKASHMVNKKPSSQPGLQALGRR